MPYRFVPLFFALFLLVSTPPAEAATLVTGKINGFMLTPAGLTLSLSEGSAEHLFVIRRQSLLFKSVWFLERAAGLRTRPRLYLFLNDKGDPEEAYLAALVEEADQLNGVRRFRVNFSDAAVMQPDIRFLLVDSGASLHEKTPGLLRELTEIDPRRQTLLVRFGEDYALEKYTILDTPHPGGIPPAGRTVLFRPGGPKEDLTAKKSADGKPEAAASDIVSRAISEIASETADKEKEPGTTPGARKDASAAVTQAPGSPPETSPDIPSEISEDDLRQRLRGLKRDAASLLE